MGASVGMRIYPDTPAESLARSASGIRRKYAGEVDLLEAEVARPGDEAGEAAEESLQLGRGGGCGRHWVITKGVVTP